MLYHEWEINAPPKQGIEALAKQIHCGELLTGVMLARGLQTPEQVEEMIGEPDALPSPFLMKDMDKAVERIMQAVHEEEPIVIFGDYDVDGITATALLYTCLESMGAQIFYKLPSRADTGYGLTEEVVKQIAGHDSSLIITVDNGTSAVEAATLAKELEIDIVMTDHHLPPPVLPDVVALVNPHLEDDVSPYEGLSGVGVAFMLAAALEDCTPEELLPNFSDLVAIGTVADVMKLKGYNRTLVQAGLAILSETRRPGLAALIEVCGWKGKAVTTENISYGIAPRLNAAGRMGDATNALRLLLTDDEEEAMLLVEDLQEQNHLRQKTEQEISEIIAKEIDETPALQRAPVLVVWGEGWHQGIIGIVASRLTERYGKPAIVISLENGEGRGSGRSLSGFSLYDAISSCADILVRFGGHALAAGLTIEEKYLEEFRTRVNTFAVENHPVILLPSIKADVALSPEITTVQQVAELEKMAPFGSGNPSPKFLLENAVVEGVFSVGEEGKHCRVKLNQNGLILHGVLFGNSVNTLAYKVGDHVEVVLALSLYNGKNGEQISTRIIDMRPAEIGNDHAAESALFQSFVAGAKITAEQKQSLCPSREDTGLVYRLLRKGRSACQGDLRPIFNALKPVSAGKVLASIAALEELGLIVENEKMGCYKPVEVKEKKDLSDSTILHSLEV